MQVVLAGAVGWSETEMGERDWERDTKGACEARTLRACFTPPAQALRACYMYSFRIERGARWMPYNSTVVNTFLRTAAETLPLVR